MDNTNRGTFDKLVSGLSLEDRASMLENINKTAAPAVQLVETEDPLAGKNITLRLRLRNESIFYKIILWFRSIIQKKDSEKIYNEDVLASLARRVNRDHPGILNHRFQVLDSLFYEHLKALKEASDFFKPYFAFIDDNPGDFYVFLSSLITPQLSDKINSNADPFTLSFDTEATSDVKSKLLKNLDEILNSMAGSEKSSLYYAVSSVNWLKQFTRLPYLHFASQFTNIAGSNFTCPYKNAKNDYDSFSAVFTNIQTVQREVLEGMLLFSQRKEITKNAQDKDIERTVKEFLAQANHHLASIQMFLSTVPVYKVGKIINEDYDWTPGNISGAEAWFPSFRNQWRKILEVRWNEWVRERKKNTLSANLKADFKLDEFPVMTYRPWTQLWTRVPFACELTGGFLSWFCQEEFDDILTPLNEVMMEGVFVKNENRVDYSEGLNLFVQANNQMKELMFKISPDGDYGALFEEFSNNKLRTFQVQNQIDSMMSSIESEIHDVVGKFCKGIRLMDKIFKGMFGSQNEVMHDTLQNIMSIKGHQNRAWRDKLSDITRLLRRALFYIIELEPIDAATSKA
ncbi:MAG: DUF5312 domain-containing protein [Treponema sp.]|nr:DUF5312 domain-containing protein [Treponema sp.]